MLKKKNNCSLLPHIEETIFGFNRNSAQIYGWQFNKFNIQAEWNLSCGENTTVAVIDTGCDLSHRDLKNNLIDGKNFIEPKKDPIDDNGHGTHVSGIIAAENNGLGMVGISPQTKIIPVKALDGAGNGNNDTIAEAIVWAANRGCDFIAMSLGSPSDSASVKKAINYAIKKKCIIFCAAGNSGPNSDIMYPAKYPSTIAIGSIGQNLRRSKFTCSGDSLDFLAPGENIISCTPNNNYSLMSGTSMANPLAVGYACLLASYAKKYGLINKLRNKDNYLDIFKQNTLKLSDKNFTGNKKYEGYGIIQPSIRILKT